MTWCVVIMTSHCFRLDLSAESKFQSSYKVPCAKLSVSAAERKKRGSGEKTNERKTAEREKGRACKHLFKYLNPRRLPPPPPPPQTTTS